MKRSLFVVGLAALIITGCSSNQETEQATKTETEVKKEETFGIEVSEEVRTLKIIINKMTVTEDQIKLDVSLENSEDGSTPVEWDATQTNIVINETQFDAAETSLGENNESGTKQEGEIIFDIGDKKLTAEVGEEIKLNLGKVKIGGIFSSEEEIRTSAVLQ